MNWDRITGHAADKAAECVLALAPRMEPGKAQEFIWNFLHEIPHVEEDTAFVARLPVLPGSDGRDQWGITHVVAVVRPFYKAETPLGHHMVRTVFFTREDQLNQPHLRVRIIKEG